MQFGIRNIVSLVLARDRIGEKPIYYGWQGNGDRRVFIFGSELKALKVHPEFNRAINREAVALQLRHNYIPDPYSIYENIYKLLPGHYIELSNQDLKKGFLPRPKTYWSVTDCVIQGVNNQFKSDEIELQKVLKKFEIINKKTDDIRCTYRCFSFRWN